MCRITEFGRSRSESKRMVGLPKNRIGGQLTEFGEKAEFVLNQMDTYTYTYAFLHIK